MRKVPVGREVANGTKNLKEFAVSFPHSAAT